MHIQQFIKAGQFLVSEGSVYGWNCYGVHARFLDLDMSKFSDHDAISCVFDSKTQQVFEVDFVAKGKAYRWVDPNFKKAYEDEAKSRNVDPNECLEGLKYYDCEVEEDILEKIEQYITTGSYDNRVIMPLDLDEDILMVLFKEAHKKDITFNQLMEEIILEAVERAEAVVRAAETKTMVVVPKKKKRERSKKSAAKVK